jgi:hypothetical protein
MEVKLEPYKLVQMYRVMCEMMDCRGYNVTEERQNLPDQEVLERYRDSMQRAEMFHHLTDESRHCCVFLNTQQAAINNQFVDQLVRFADESFRHLVIVTHEPSKTSINKRCVEMSEKYRLSNGRHVEFLQAHHLMFNVLKHYLVPKHVLMAPGEKADLLAK